MKKNLSISGLCALVALMLFISESNLNGQALYFGIKGGLAIPNLRDNSSNPLSSGYSSRTAPVYGVFAGEQISSLFDIQVELLYAGQGGQKNGMQALPQMEYGQYLYANFNSVSKLNYLEVPILFKLNLNLHVLQVYIDAGPYFGYLSSADQKNSGKSPIYLGNDVNVPLSPPQDLGKDTTITSQIHKFNFGIAGGIGISKSIGPGTLILDGRVDYGLTNIQKYAADGTNKTGAVFITLGYAVKL